MATQKKIIGKLPVFRGEYNKSVVYYKHNIVTYLGSSFISTKDENMSVPCTVGDKEFILSSGWAFFSDSSEAYFMDERFDEMAEVVVTTDDEGEVNNVEPDVVNEAIRKTPQILSKAEQAQARANISAASLEENAAFKKEVTESNEAFKTEIDAKVSDIGSEVESLDYLSKSALIYASNSLDINVGFDKVGYYTSDGNYQQSELYRNTGFVTVNERLTVNFECYISGEPSITFWDKKKNIIPELNVIGNGDNIGTIDFSGEKYIEVAFIVVSNRTFNQPNPKLELKGSGSLSKRVEVLETETRENGDRFIRNILRGNVFAHNGYLNVGGVFVENASYVCTDFMLLNKSNDVFVFGGYAGESSLLISFYDENKTFIQGINNAQEVSIKHSDIPLNAYYYRCGTKAEYADKVLIVNEDLLSLKRRILETEVNVNLNKETINQLESIVTTKELNLSAYGYIGIDGSISTTTNARRTEYVSIDSYDKLKWGTNISETGASVAFFDKDKSYLQDLTIAGTGTYNEGIVNLKEEKYKVAKFVVLSYYDRSQIYANYKGELYNEDSIENRLEQIEESQCDKNGLNILIFGDSITTCASIDYNSEKKTISYSLNKESNGFTDENGNWVKYSMWPYLLTELFKCNDVRNYAQAGASFKDANREAGNERQNLSFQIDLALNDIPNQYGAFATVGNFNPDIIIFALGTNDGNPNDSYESAMNKSVVVGDDFDVDSTIQNLDMSKFCESARRSFLRVCKAFPTSQKICVLPIQRAGREQQLVGVNEELRKMAERYSMIVVDGCSELGIIRDFEKVNSLGMLLKDGLHPNNEGQKMFARMIGRYIKQYIAIE